MAARRSRLAASSPRCGRARSASIVLTRLETVKASAPFSIKRRRSRFSGASAPGRTMQCSVALDRASRSAASRAPRKPVAPVRRIFLPSRRPTPDCPIPGRTSSGRTASANICSNGSDWSGCVDERGAEPSIHAASSRIVMDSCARSGGTSTPRASSTAAVSSMTPNESAPRSDRGATTSSTRRRRRSVPDAADRRTDSVSDSRAVLDAGPADIMPSSPAATPRRKHPTVRSWAAIRIAHLLGRHTAGSCRWWSWAGPRAREARLSIAGCRAPRQRRRGCSPPAPIAPGRRPHALSTSAATATASVSTSRVKAATAPGRTAGAAASTVSSTSCGSCFRPRTIMTSLIRPVTKSSPS